MAISLQSLDYQSEQQFKYSYTKTLNPHTVSTKLEVVVSLFHDRYIDRALITKFEFQMGLKGAIDEDRLKIHSDR